MAREYIDELADGTIKPETSGVDSQATDNGTHVKTLAPIYYTPATIANDGKATRETPVTIKSALEGKSNKNDGVYYVIGTHDYAAYSATATYTATTASGPFTSANSCVYSGKAYFCKTAISTPEAWNSGHWTAIPTPVLTGTIDGVTELYAGLKIAYKFSITGGSSSTYLNINNLGNKYIRRNDGNLTTHIPYNSAAFLVFDGTYWLWADYDTDNIYAIHAACSTAAATQAKTATAIGYVLTAGETFLIRFSYANAYAGKLTLNVNSQGAKDIWINGSVSSASNYNIPAGIWWCHYDGTVYHIWTDGSVMFKELRLTTKLADDYIASATTWNAKQDALAVQTAYSAKGTATKVPQITTNSLGQVTGITEVTISGVTPASHASTATTYGIGTTSTYGHVKLATGDMNGALDTDGVAVSKNHTHSQYAPKASPALTGTPTAPTAADGTNTTQIATTAFVQSAVTQGLSVSDAMVYKGTVTLGATSPGGLTVAADRGHTYKVVANGNTKEGYVDGVKVEAGDMVICNTDSTAAATSSNYSTIAAKWDFVQGNTDGVVVGPSSAVSGNVVLFDGATGKLIKDGGTLGTAAFKSVTDTYSSTGTNPVSGKAIAAAIETLDVTEVGGDGKYIKKIKEDNGKITATVETMDTTPTASSTKAVTSGGIKTALDSKVSSIKKNGATITPSDGVADIGYMPVTEAQAITTAVTVQEVIQALRVKPGGRMGSAQLSESTISGTSIPAAWYNYIWIPHRTGAPDGDNQNFGTLILTPLSSTPDVYVIEGSSLNTSSPTYRIKRLDAVTAEAAIATGDKLLFSDDSDGSKTKRMSTGFDTDVTTTMLRRDGTFAKVLYADEGWGGSFRTSLSPFDNYAFKSANCFFGAKPSAIAVEYSNDGGTTWTDYGCTDEQKVKLFSQYDGYNVYCGHNMHIHPGYTGTITGTKDLSNENIANQRLRITICESSLANVGTTSTTDQWIYCNIRRFGIYMSTQSASGGAHCLVEYRTRDNFRSNTDTWVSVGDFKIQGDSGWNSIPANNAKSENKITFGNSQGSHAKEFRFTIWSDQLSATPAAISTGNMLINRIVAYSELLWSNSSSRTAIGYYGSPCTVDPVSGTLNLGKAKFTARELSVDLSSTSTTATSFDGTANVSIKNTGTLPVSKGGTGKTTAPAAEYNLLPNARTEITTYDDNSRFLCESTAPSEQVGVVSGFRKASTIWNYIMGKISSVLGLTATNYGGTADTATKVSGTQVGQDDNDRHLWFSTTVETQRGYIDSLTYRTDTNTISANISGNAAKVTVSEDASNELQVVGVQSSATSTLKRDSGVTVQGGAVKATTFKLGTNATITYNSTTEAIDFTFL